ncbi:Cytochrome P450, E-class, group I [Parasponia andersonii]|uniref:Cytochrome P450, E-class, group I n=1 Tax=Parasponia andersonii TaxID=3476 RepID=A0A2P5BYF2_PARAD|nr:Cytochrome P450, E-class, group I [Parasponia andersonii]
MPLGFLTMLWLRWVFEFKSTRITPSRVHLPPGPKGFPLLGYLPYLGPNFHHLFMNLAQVYGPIYKLTIDQRLCVIISCPSLPKEVVCDQDIIFANRNPNMATLIFSFGGIDIGFAPYGPQWRLLRKIFLREMLSTENLDAFYTLRRKELKRSVRDLMVKRKNVSFRTALIYHDEATGNNDGDEFLYHIVMLLSHISLIHSHPFHRHYYRCRCPLVAPPVPEEHPTASAGPRGLPLVGYIPFLGQNLHRDFSRLANLYGPIYKLWLGNKLCVVISSPSLLKQVVRDQDTVFSNRDPVVSMTVATYGGNDIALAPYGPAWKKLRKIFVGKMLSNSVLDNLYGRRRKAVKESVSRIYGAGIGTPVDVGSLAMLTAVNSVLTMLCGASSVKGEEGDAVNLAELQKASTELMVLFGKPNVSDLFPWLAWLDIQGVAKETRKVRRVFEVMIDSAIEKTKKVVKEKGTGGHESKDFVQFLFDLHEHGDDETSITIPQLKAMLMCLLHLNNYEKILQRRIPLGEERLLSYALASFLHSFDWKLPPDAKLELSDTFGIVVKKQEPLTAIPAPRLSNLELYS